MPKVLNPEKGYIVMANNRVIPNSVSNNAGLGMISTSRSQRITDMIEHYISHNIKMSTMSMKLIMSDTRSYTAERNVASILKIIDQSELEVLSMLKGINTRN